MSKLYISMYHYVRDLRNSRYPNIKGMDISLFKKQINFYKENFTFVTIEDVIASYDEGIPLPENSLLLTFDDGYIDHYTSVFPILQENGIQGSFFISGKTFSENVLLDVNKIHFVLASAPIDQLYKEILDKIDDVIRNNECHDLPSKEELSWKYATTERFDGKEVVYVKRMLQTVLPESIRNRIASELFSKYVGIDESKFAHELYMNIDQIKCMKRNGMFIGLHGYDHYWLGNLPKEKMESDISASLNALSEVVERDNYIMNYPYGNYNDDVLDFLRKTGCKLGMTTEAKIADVKKDDRLLLPRLDCNDFPPKSGNYKNCKGD